MSTRACEAAASSAWDFLAEPHQPGAALGQLRTVVDQPLGNDSEHPVERLRLAAHRNHRAGEFLRFAAAAAPENEPDHSKQDQRQRHGRCPADSAQQRQLQLSPPHREAAYADPGEREQDQQPGKNRAACPPRLRLGRSYVGKVEAFLRPAGLARLVPLDPVVRMRHGAFCPCTHRGMLYQVWTQAKLLLNHLRLRLKPWPMIPEH